MVEAGDYVQVERALEEGADVENEGGRIPLYAAVEQGSVELVELLLEHGADVHWRTRNDETPAYLAAQNGYVDILKRLADRGADLGRGVAGGCKSALRVAIRYGEFEVVRYLVEDYAVDLEAVQEWERCEPVDAAASNGQVDILKYLLEQGFEPDVLNGLGMTPLHSAVAYADAQDYDDETMLAMVDLLLAHGADPDITGGRTKRKRRGTPDVNWQAKKNVLDVALRYGSAPVIRRLLEYGVEPSPPHETRLRRSYRPEMADSPVEEVVEHNDRADEDAAIEVLREYGY